MTARTAFCRSVWRGMAVLYGRPAIGELCLGLQAEFDADVPLLLTLVLADAAGEGLDGETFERLTGAAAAWRDIAVLPLRRLRVRLKDVVAGPEEVAFRQSVKAAELEAERIEVARILALFEPAPGPAGGLAATYLAGLGVPAERAAAVLDTFRRALAAPQSRSASPC